MGIPLQQGGLPHGIDRYPELVALQTAQELKVEALLQSWREIADIRGAGSGRQRRFPH